MKHSQSSRATLELHGPGSPPQVIELKGGDLQIGRAAGQEIHLDDARVSRHHARIEHRADGAYYIVDLDSKSSTSLDGRKLFPFHPVRAARWQPDHDRRIRVDPPRSRRLAARGLRREARRSWNRSR